MHYVNTHFHFTNLIVNDKIEWTQLISCDINLFRFSHVSYDSGFNPRKGLKSPEFRFSDRMA